MSGTNSPSQLTPPPRRLRPRRLNRLPLLIGLMIFAIIISAFGYAISGYFRHPAPTEAEAAATTGKIHGGKAPGFLEANLNTSAEFNSPPPPPKPSPTPETPPPPATTAPPPGVSGGLTLDEQARAQAWQAYYQQLAQAQAARAAMEQAIFSGSTDAMAGAGGGGNGLAQPSDSQSGNPLQNNANANGIGPYSIGGVNPAGQTGKQAFLKTPGDPYGLGENMEGAVHGPKPLTIMEGTALPAITAEAATSDSPGQLVAYINTNVCDDMTGDNLLIPIGTKIITTYDTAVSIGQDRMGTIAQRLIFPDTSSRQIGSMQVADQSGEAGLHDLLNTHFWEKFGTALTVAIIGAGTQLAQPQQSAFASPSGTSAATGAFTQQMSQFGINQAQSAMQIPNTIELRPALPILVKLNKDLPLPIYHDARGNFNNTGCGFVTR